jgi:hypothetical protein
MIELKNAETDARDFTDHKPQRLRDRRCHTQLDNKRFASDGQRSWWVPGVNVVPLNPLRIMKNWMSPRLRGW